MLPGWVRLEEDGISVFVRLTPKSARDAVEGAETAADGRVWLKARVRAVPEDGKANKALEKLIAKAAGAPKSTVSVVAGQTSRVKTVRIACAPEEAAAAIERLANTA